MATCLRLLRTGSHKRPDYRLVAIDKAKANKGGIIENLGHYLVRRVPEEFELNEERALYWLKEGALPSESAKSLLKRAGIWTKHLDATKKPAKAAKAA